MTTGLLEKRIYYHDTDCGGVVYHASYLRHLEEGRTEFLRAKGIDAGELASQGTILPVIRLEVDYKSPARYADIIRIITTIEKIGHASIYFAQEIKRGETLILEAKTVLACVDSDLRTKPLPDTVRQKLLGIPEG